MITKRTDYFEILKLGGPVLVTQIGMILVAFADTMMVGAYGVDELAASAFVNSFFVVAVVAQIGFASGLTPLAGALYGKGDSRGVGMMLRAGLQVNLLVSVGISIVMGTLYFFVGNMGQPIELLGLIRQYYLIVLGTLVPVAVFNTFQQTANSINDTAMPMWVILGANILNVIGNYALIFGHFGLPEMGLNGAGISTLVSRLLGSIVIVCFMLNHKKYRNYRSGFYEKISRGKLRKQVWITSYPVMIQSGLECFLWTVGAVVCGWFGKIQLAAYQVVNTIGQLGFMIYLSFSTACSIKVSNYTGTGNRLMVRRVTTASLHLILVLATLASIAFFLFGHPLVWLFNDDAGVIDSALGLIVPLIVYQYMDGIQLTFAAGLRGMSDVKPLLYVALISYVLLGMPSMYALAVGADMGNVGVYLSFVVALGAAALLLGVSFYKGLRKIG